MLEGPRHQSLLHLVQKMGYLVISAGQSDRLPSIAIPSTGAAVATFPVSVPLEVLASRDADGTSKSRTVDHVARFFNRCRCIVHIIDSIRLSADLLPKNRKPRHRKGYPANVIIAIILTC